MRKQMGISKLYQCIKSKNVNNSQAREAIYRVLMDAGDECLSVTRILDELSCVYPKKISINTVYRHLDLFTSCKLAVVVQDNFKKAHYCLTGETPLVFIVCKRCKRVEKCILNPNHFMENLGSSDYVTIHKKCKKCR